MSYYRHYDLDTRIGLMVGEWMYKARNGSTDVGGQPPVEPPHGAGACADLKSLPPLPSGAILEPFNLQEPAPDEFSLREGWLISFVAGFVFVASVVLLFVDLG